MPPPSCPSEYKPGLTVSHYYRDFSHSPPVVLLASVLRCFPHPTRHLASTTRQASVQITLSAQLLQSFGVRVVHVSSCTLLEKIQMAKVTFTLRFNVCNCLAPSPSLFQLQFLFYSYFIPILFQDSPTILFYRASVPTFIVTEATLSPTVHTE